MNDPLKHLRSELESHIAAGTFPGGIVARAHQGMIEFILPLGRLASSPARDPVRKDSVYDVASLTKPLVTALTVLVLFQDHHLNPDMCLGELYDNCPVDKSRITISDLLTHYSGIVDWYPLFAEAGSIAGYAEKILTLPLAAEPRTRVIYSCPNYILLADVIRRVTDMPFVEAAEKHVIKSLGLRRSFLCAPPVPLKEIAATEEGSLHEAEMMEKFDVDYPLRTRLVHGQVHDTNSFAAGGSAGNSGLFTTVTEAIALAEQYGPRSILLKTLTRQIATRNYTPDDVQHRSFGWQLATSEECGAGEALSGAAYGHSGFTGTSIWHDPHKDITLVIFTNRIHPRVKDVNMNEIRRELHRLMMEIP
jgi:CubicO group peptidase (beta-lactamase class C family)